MNKNAFQVTVEEHSSLLLFAALAPQQLQDAGSDLRGEGLLEVIFSRHEAQQTFSDDALWIEALADVKAVWD